MHKHIAILAAAVLALAVAVLALAACGGGGQELILEEYFQRLEAIENDSEQRLVSLNDEYRADSESASEEERAAAFRHYAQGVASNAEDAHVTARELEPPDEAEDAHNALVEAEADLVDAARALNDRAAGVETETQLEELFSSDPDANAADERIEATCRDLERIAFDNGINVDLACD